MARRASAGGSPKLARRSACALGGGGRSAAAAPAGPCRLRQPICAARVAASAIHIAAGTARSGRSSRVMPSGAGNRKCRRRRPEQERRREHGGEQRAEEREAGEAAKVLRRARKRQRQHELQPLLVDLAPHARHDLRSDHEHRAHAQQRGDHRGLQEAALGQRELREERAERQAEDQGERRDPGETAAARFEEREAGENGRGHAFVCRLVAAAMQHASLTQPVFARLANATWSFTQRYWRLVVVAMLLLLHIAVFRGVADPWARALLLAHLGLLLLWQPFLRAEQRVSPTQGLILGLVAFAVMMHLDWWLLAFWVVVIAGLVGGKVYQQDARWQRRVYLVVLAYLLALLAVAILPEIA